MSRTPNRATRAGRARLAGAAAVMVLLAACGGGDSGSDASAESSAGDTGAAASGSASGSEFCRQAADLDQRVDEALSDVEGADSSVADAFTQLAEELRGIEAPEAIRDDWAALAGGLDRMSGALADLDITDPDSVAGLEEAGRGLETASTNVETYLRDECGIDP